LFRGAQPSRFAIIATLRHEFDAERSSVAPDCLAVWSRFAWF
jgi:hypothetical protein